MCNKTESSSFLKKKTFKTVVTSIGYLFLLWHYLLSSTYDYSFGSSVFLILWYYFELNMYLRRSVKYKRNTNLYAENKQTAPWLKTKMIYRQAIKHKPQHRKPKTEHHDTPTLSPHKPLGRVSWFCFKCSICRAAHVIKNTKISLIWQGTF